MISLNKKNNLKDFEINGTTLVQYKGSNPDVVIPDFITNVAAIVDSYGRCWFAFGTYGSGECVKSITIPKSLTYIDGWTFHMCPNLEKIIIDENNEMYYSEDNCVIEKESKTLIFACKNSVIPQDIKNIAYNVFVRCDDESTIVNYNGTKQQWEDIEKDFDWDEGMYNYIVHCTDGDITFDDVPFKIHDNCLWSYRGHNAKVVIPDSITHIMSDSYEGLFCFSDCDFVKSITVPKSLTNIDGETFHGCFNLEEIIVDSQNNKYYSQGNCVIKKENKTLVTGCKMSVIPEDVTSIGHSAFWECTGLTSIYIPRNIKSIGSDAFLGCSGLKSITIPNSVTSIGDYAFEGCSGLLSVTIGDGVTSIGDSAFGDCSGLTSITIPDGVTSIGRYAFSGCSSLTSVTIGDSVTSIGDYAFLCCTALTEVYFMGTAEDWGKVNISRDNDYLTDATRYCYSKTAPTDEGNYWHYDTDGVTPVKW